MQRFIFDLETQHSNTQNVGSNYKFWYSLNGQYWNSCQVTSQSKSIVDVWVLHLEDPSSSTHNAQNTKVLEFRMMRVIWNTLRGSQFFFNCVNLLVEEKNVDEETRKAIDVPTSDVPQTCNSCQSPIKKSGTFWGASMVAIACFELIVERATSHLQWCFCVDRKKDDKLWNKGK